MKTSWDVRVMDWALTALHGRYVAYAVIWGGDTLTEGKQFQRWVVINDQLREKYGRPDLYDMWLGVPEELL
jgi:hypothetical protein